MSTAEKPRQLNLDELLRLKWLLGSLMAMVGLWTVFFLDVEALGLVAVAGAVLLSMLVWPQLSGRIPALVWRLAVPAIIVTAVADWYFSPDTLPVLIRLAILLVLYRASAYRRKREDLQLLVLSLFLIVVAGVLTVSIGFAFLLLAFTACALGFLFVINLIDAAEPGTVRTKEAETAWVRLSWRKFFGRLRRVADWRLLAFATALFTAVVAMSGLLFLVIPRFEVASGFFLDRYITRKSRSGFTDTVKFGDVTELTQDTSIAMRVDLTDASGIREAPYWRLVVLDEYTNDGFKVSSALKNELLRDQTVRQLVRGRSLGRRFSPAGGNWTFYVEPGVSRYLPLPGSFATLRLRDPLPLQTSGRHRVVALRTESMTMTAFQLEGVDLAAGVTDAQLPDLLRTAGDGSSRGYDPRITLQGPPGEANAAVLRRVLAEITGGATLSAEEFGERATAWLIGRHAYALSVRIPSRDGVDQIVRWLDSNEPGYCEYFAAGLTVLARAAGHPARVVAGFHGGALNAFENYFMVKNSDAHAWVEIHDGRSTWLRFDPTPGSGGAARRNVASTTEQAQDTSFSARLDSLRILWYRRIVNFDSRQQVQMIEQVKSFTTDSGNVLRARLDEFSKRVREWLARPWDWKRIGKLVVGLGLAGAALWALARAGRHGWQRWSRWRRPSEYDPVRRAAGQWLGRVRAYPKVPPEVLRDLQQLRYGRRESWPEPRGVFKRARLARKG